MPIQVVNNADVFAVVTGQNNGNQTQSQINRVENYPVEFLRALILTGSTSYGRVFGQENPIEGRMFQKMFRVGSEVNMSIVGEIDSVLGSVSGDCDDYPKAGKINAHTQGFKICKFKAAGQMCLPDLTSYAQTAEQWLGSLDKRKRKPIVERSSSGALILGHAVREWLVTMGNEIVWSLFFGTEAVQAVNTAANAAPFYAATIPASFNPNIVNGQNKFGGYVGGLCQNNLVKQMADAAAAGKEGAYYFDTSSMLTPAGAVNALIAAINRFPEKWKNAALPVEKRLKIYVSPIIARLVKQFYSTNAETATYYNALMSQLLGFDGLRTDIAMLDYQYLVVPIAAWDAFDEKRGAMTTSTIGGVPVYHSRNLMVMIGFDGFAGAFTSYENESEATMYGMRTQIPYSILEDHNIVMAADCEFSAGVIVHKNNPFAIGYPQTQTFS